MTPSPYSAVAYDAFWVGALAENVTMLNEGNHTSREMVDGLKEAIMDSANSYFGVTGNTSLNAVGDRANGRDHYWKVVAKDVGGVAPTFSWNSTMSPLGDNRTPMTKRVKNVENPSKLEIRKLLASIKLRKVMTSSVY